MDILYRRRRLKGIHSRSDTNRTGDEGLSFYYPRLLYCLNQMLAVMLLSQHRVLSSKTIKPRAPCGAQCIGHAVRTWSAVCSCIYYISVVQTLARRGNLCGPRNNFAQVLSMTSSRNFFWRTL